MAGNIRSALIAGVLAGVIYTVIAVATGTSFGAALGTGLIYFVATAAIVFLVLMLVKAVRKDKTTG